MRIKDNPLLAMLIEHGPLFSDELPDEWRERAVHMCRRARMYGWSVFRTKLHGHNGSFSIFYLDKDKELAYKRVRRHNGVTISTRRSKHQYRNAIMDGEQSRSEQPFQLSSYSFIERTKLHEQWASDYRAGFSAREVAERNGVKVCVVYSWLSKMNVEMRPPGTRRFTPRPLPPRPKVDERTRKWTEDYLSGMTAREISAKYKVGKDKVRRTLVMTGVKMRNAGRRPSLKKVPLRIPYTELVFDFINNHPDCTSREIRDGIRVNCGRIIRNVAGVIGGLRMRNYGPTIHTGGPEYCRTYKVVPREIIDDAEHAGHHDMEGQ